jgi:hypothetical protein
LCQKSDATVINCGKFWNYTVHFFQYKEYILQLRVVKIMCKT